MNFGKIGQNTEISPVLLPPLRARTESFQYFCGDFEGRRLLSIKKTQFITNNHNQTNDST